MDLKTSTKSCPQRKMREIKISSVEKNQDKRCLNEKSNRRVLRSENASDKLENITSPKLKATKNAENKNRSRKLTVLKNKSNRGSNNIEKKCEKNIALEKNSASDFTAENNKRKKLKSRKSSTGSPDVSKSSHSKIKGKRKEVKESKEVSFDEIEKIIFEGSNPLTKAINSTESKIKSLEDKARKKAVNAKEFIKESEESLSETKNPVTKNLSLKSSSKKDVKISKSKEKTGKSISPKNKNKTVIKGKKKSLKGIFENNVKKEVDTDSDVSEWEEVDELTEILDSKGEEKPENVQIELESQNVLWGWKKRRRRKEQELIEDYLRKEINKSIKEVHGNMHKTHLLCLLAHGIYLNSILQSEVILSCALSIIPKLYYSPKRLDIPHLEKFLSWFCKAIPIKQITNTATDCNRTIEEILEKRFDEKYATNTKELVLMFVGTTRSIGMKVRYVQSLNPITWKPPASNLIKPKKNLDCEIKDTLPNKNHLKDEKLVEIKSEPTVKGKVVKSTKVKRKMLSSDSDFSDSGSRPKAKSKKAKNSRKSSSSAYSKENEGSSKNDKRPINLSERRISGDSESGKKKVKKESFLYWAEVYVEEEEKWISVDVSRNKIHCANEIEARSSNLAYVVAFNPNQTVKDVTKRYMSTWLSYKDKLRCDGEWWEKSLKPFEGKKDRMNLKEDKELEKNLKMQPLPKTINEYKSHPLYALQRNLLKFEAIYPPDCSPVGFIRGEAVYPRESVKTLYGRESWFKEAKTVRVEEEPYKIVKARPKWDRSTCQIIKDRPLELFGEWQVEDYEPPIAKNGKVPRNEYGNVDLFKPSMLPKGCVHLPVSGLYRVARKLNIDIAPAVTGFDYHTGGCHAVYEGYVVCEEFKDLLMDAWNEDQVEREKREEEKRVKRIYGNWKKLVLGLTLKYRIKEKYGVSSEGGEGSSNFSVPEELPKKKIQQEDLDALPSAVITHHIPNLKIDMTTSVTEGMKRKKTKGKGLTKRSKRNAPNGESRVVNDLNPLSESEEDSSDSDKRERIRNILSWNPEGTENQNSYPGLSDCSEGEEDSHLNKSSLMLTPISDVKSESGNRNEKGLSKTQKRKTKRNLNKPQKSVMDLSSDSENEATSRRISLRKKRRNADYKESGESRSDISVDDSDTGDATYVPIRESD